MEMQTQLSDEAETQESKLSFASLYTQNNLDSKHLGNIKSPKWHSLGAATTF